MKTQRQYYFYTYTLRRFLFTRQYSGIISRETENPTDGEYKLKAKIVKRNNLIGKNYFITNISKL